MWIWNLLEGFNGLGFPCFFFRCPLRRLRPAGFSWACPLQLEHFKAGGEPGLMNAGTCSLRKVVEQFL